MVSILLWKPLVMQLFLVKRHTVAISSGQFSRLLPKRHERSAAGLAERGESAQEAWNQTLALFPIHRR